MKENRTVICCPSGSDSSLIPIHDTPSFVTEQIIDLIVGIHLTIDGQIKSPHIRTQQIYISNTPKQEEWVWIERMKEERRKNDKVENERKRRERSTERVRRGGREGKRKERNSILSLNSFKREKWSERIWYTENTLSLWSPPRGSELRGRETQRHRKKDDKKKEERKRMLEGRNQRDHWMWTQYSSDLPKKPSTFPRIQGKNKLKWWR